MDLKSGNFDKTDFAMFADSNTNLLIEAFEFRHFTKNILDKGAIIDQLKKDLDMSDEDIDFYISKEFAFVFPDNNFDKWGIVLGYKDDKRIDSRMAIIKKIKEGSKKNFYTDYVIETFKIKEDRFILISNSKVTLDQMKEFAEGNVQNLSKSAVYVDLIKDLPKFGSMFVYKKENTATWEYFINQAIKKYDKVQSLDVALKSIPSSRRSFFLRMERRRRLLTNP
ncbi:hypothetical protein LDC_0445 [sediment metagenome]|uniref:Uncharacterized protein n=1 Tax=sediment metagenome TaxID=749907 RepID=D9PG00_9ZZZZ